MRKGLGEGHVAPLALTPRVKTHDALPYVFSHNGIEEVFHIVLLRSGIRREPDDFFNMQHRGLLSKY